MKRSTFTKIIIYVLISLLGLIMLYPLIWMIFAALKPSPEGLSCARCKVFASKPGPASKPVPV